MIRRPRHAAGALALGAAAALSLSACGSDSLSDAGSGSSSSSVPSATAQSGLAGKLPAKVQTAKKIVVGTDASYAPSEFLAADGKTVQGFDVDLFKAVGQKFGVDVQFVSSNFDSIITGVGTGKYDVGVSSFTINPERKKQANMVSYYQAGTQWATQKGNPKKVDPANACGLTIAVQTATVQAEEDLPKRQADCKKAGKPGIKVQSYTGQDEATAAVGSKKADAMLADSPVAAYAVKQTKGTLELLGDVYDSAPYGYVLPKNETEFAAAVVEALKALKTDGTYEKVLKNWGVESGAIDSFAVNP
ncbi:MAG TPA: ABC transporter substrate-binding protein [Actinomycetales bacterium]|nr:ABC transporter substrate-binding protein [Actinomycetales bacterium]